MGSTTPPESSHDRGRPLTSEYNPEVSELPDSHQLLQLLAERDSEIRRLKSELEKYKSAVRNFRIDLTEPNDEASCSGDDDITVESLLHSMTLLTSEKTPTSSELVPDSDTGPPEAMFNQGASSVVASSVESLDKSLQMSDEKEVSDIETVTEDIVRTFSNEDIKTNLANIIDNVDDIDLSSKSNKNRKKSKNNRGKFNDQDVGVKCDIGDDGKEQQDDNENSVNQGKGNLIKVAVRDEDLDGTDDMITEGLLTSLTDAAISNLSQLAALQERSESQQEHSQHHKQQKTLTHEEFQTGKNNQPIHNAHVFPHQSTASLIPAAAVPHQAMASTSRGLRDHGMPDVHHDDSFDIHDPFSTSNIANQAALALEASVGAPSLLGHQISVSSSSSSGVQNVAPEAQKYGTGQSLASVVAAAAAAAAEAAAVDEQQLHKQQLLPGQQQHQHQLQPQQSRLISSAIASPDFYQNLHQASLVHQITSPISALHFSPSITSPSPTSLFGAPSSHSRRSMSNNSSSMLSPISSPNFLRRHLVSERGLPMMSPSPSASLVTVGSSSGVGSSASSSHMFQLAHQQQHHGHPQHPHHQANPQQQRSASALAGSISSSASPNVSLSNAPSTSVNPLIASKNSSQARLNNMQIRHKFGYLGSGRGQFNSPHGFCLGPNQEIVVADTNNHRVCIFDKGGTFITQFGSPGKEEGQLWNPRKVAILHRTFNGATGCAITSGADPSASNNRAGPGTTFSSSFTSGGGIQSTGSNPIGNSFSSEPMYVVCDRGAERSRMQLFTKDGAFIKKIGIHYIDIVAGLAITQNGLIIVVDSVSPTVYIINAETGTLNGWFDCSGHMKEPSDIAVKSNIPGNEYFICDFKGHCVVVFSEQGDYLRKIGHDGLTSYPNGIDISDDGDILVGDSHGNRFHVVVFDRNGELLITLYGTLTPPLVGPSSLTPLSLSLLS